jgi:hypothetical protein
MLDATIVGVDAGKSGAAAAYEFATDAIVDIIDLPLDADRDLDAADFYLWLSQYENLKYLIVEDCWQPLTLIRMCGEIAACGKLAGATVERIAVVTWKKEMLGFNTSDKQESIKKCQTLRPTAKIIKPRARTPSPDRAEAVLLALFAKQRYASNHCCP